jgi:hypothetical protein
LKNINFSLYENGCSFFCSACVWYEFFA